MRPFSFAGFVATRTLTFFEYLLSMFGLIFGGLLTLENTHRYKLAKEINISPGSGSPNKVVLLWIGVLSCSIGIATAVGYLIQMFYHPDLAKLSARAEELLIGAVASRPEPVEALITRICIVVLGLSVPSFYLLFRSRLGLQKKQVELMPITVLASTIPLILLFVDFAVRNPFSRQSGKAVQNDRDLIASTNFSFFFEGFFLGNYLLYYIVFVVPLVAIFFFWGVRERGWDKTKLYSLLSNYLGFGLITILLLAIFVMNTYEFPYTHENRYDFDTVYYSMTQVFAGSPMLVNDFTNTYGLYPHFLNPIFQLIGLSIGKFSGVMSALVVAAFVLNFLVLRRLVADRVILFLGFITVLFFPYLDSKMAVSFDSYFAMYPIRYIVPSAMLFAAMRYFTVRKQWVYYSIFLFLGFAMLWNPEMGIVSMVAWTAANIYRDLLDDTGKLAWKPAVLHVTIAMLAVVSAFSLFAATVRVVYGAWPDLTLLFRTMSVFGELGFNMLPMALVHPWNIVVLILLLGYLYSIAARFRTVTVKSSMVFLLTMTSLGFFIYFQGRSHNWSFSTSSGFAMMLLVILGDELWTLARLRRHLAMDILFVSFLLVITFSLIEVTYGAPAIAKLAFPEEAKTASAGYRQMVESNRDFIRNNTAEHEKILLLTAAPRQGLYFDGLKRVSIFNPTVTEMFLNASVPRLEQAVRSGPDKIFIEGAECRFGYLLRPLLVLSANYELAAVNGDISLMKKRAPLPAMTYLNRSEGLVFHRKYTDDKGSTDQRMNDAMGAEPVVLDSAFSVGVLFRASPQVCPAAALLSNLADSSGFLIESRNHGATYFFGLFGDGLEGKMGTNGWIYFALNIYPDRMEVFMNGDKIGVKPLVRRYRNSTEKLRIGGKDETSVAYYMGGISEVAIINRPLSAEEIAAMFTTMRNMR